MPLNFMTAAFDPVPWAPARRWPSHDWLVDTIIARTLREYGVDEQVSPGEDGQPFANYYIHWPGHSKLGDGLPLIDTRCYFGVRIPEAKWFHHGRVLFTDYTTPVMWAYETQPAPPRLYHRRAPAGRSRSGSGVLQTEG